MSSWIPTASSLNATNPSSWIDRKVMMAGTSFVQLLVQAFLIAIVINSASGLYEDQAGKWDWRQTFVGRITNLLPLHLSPIPSVIVSTESNVVASISVRNGTLLWRSLLEERKLADPKADGINLLSLDSEEVLYGLKDTAVPELHFITVSGNGRYVRKWSLRGVLIWEMSLPDDYDRSISGEQNVLFHVDHKRQHLHVVELHPLRVATFHLSRGDSSLSIIQSQSINSNVFGNHIKSKDCIFANDDVVVCIDSKSMSLKHINIIEKRITSYTLASIGLETSSTTSDLQLKLLRVSTTESLICLSLSSDGQVVLRVTSGNISLVKILPKAVAVTVAPISLSGDYGAFVLISKPDDPRQFKVACFNTRDWNEEMSLNDQFAVAEGTSPFVRSFWVLPFLKDKNLVKSYKILLLMEDDSFVQISPSGGTNWIREESLASVSSVVFVDLPLSELDAQLDDESDNGFWVSPATILSNFVHRISTQITQLQTIARIAAQEIAIFLDPSNVPASRLSLAAALGASSDSMTRDYFGLHKLMVIFTQPGKIIAMDTRGGDIIWSLVDSQLSQEVLKSSSDSQLPSSHKVSIFLQRTSSHAPLPAVCTIVTKSGFVFSFDPISGKVLDRKSTGQSVKQLMLMNHATHQHLKGIILQTSNNKVIVYPESASEELVNNKYFMMTADSTTGTLEGFSINFKEADRLWTQKIPVDPKEAQPLVVYFKRHSEVVHSLGRVLGDRNVFYKYLNPNLVTIVTQRSEESTSSSPTDKGSFGVVDVYLIDSVTGRIIHSTSHKRSRGPVFVVHSENSVIYSLYNEKARRTELTAIDLYEGLAQINGSVFSSVDQGSWKPLIEQNSFIFPTGIRAMTDTVTEKGITNKHLMIALPSGGLLELPKAFLDPRRRFNLTMEHREEGIIQYIPELSIPSEGFVNYNQSLMKVKGIEVAPSGLESTCLVFAHGLDIFYTRVTPSKTFDILKDDFDHLLISGVLVILIALAYVSKWLAAQKSLKAAWT